MNKIAPEFMQARIAEAIARADSATLSHVKEQHLSSASVWQRMADAVTDRESEREQDRILTADEAPGAPEPTRDDDLPERS
jgi:hypothetical protein